MVHKIKARFDSTYARLKQVKVTSQAKKKCDYSQESC